jgi:Zn finger protein HypA/HybF involved in hydrogenase expression
MRADWRLIMTLRPEYKKCPKCGKKYSWNPDVGMRFCPHCMGTGWTLDGEKKKRIGKKRND